VEDADVKEIEWDIVENAPTPDQTGQTGGNSIDIDWDLSFDVEVSSVVPGAGGPTTDAAAFSREKKSAAATASSSSSSSSSVVDVEVHTTDAPCRSCSDVMLDPLRREALGNNLREVQSFLRQRLLARQDSDMSQP
jgi:hypothetical protein